MSYKKKILLTGGGTGGSVTPLLGVADAAGDYEYFWIGTRQGIEKEIVKRQGIKYFSIFSGKLRRYFSLKNFIDPFLVIIGFFQALIILIKNRPSLIISAGSFVSVPVVWAGWFLRIPILVHQMDYRPGLANKLMAQFATKITVALEKSLEDYGDKAVWIGNFIRKEFKQYSISKEESHMRLNLNNEKLVVLILGGGTGSESINELTKNSLPQLLRICQVLHITGKDKGGEKKVSIKGYHPIEFVHTDGMIKAFIAADIVVSRCGMGVLTELSFLGKPSILIPLPGTHQEDNAELFFREKAGLILDQNEITPEIFVSTIKKLIHEDVLCNTLRDNIKRVIKTDADKEIGGIIENTIKKCQRKI